MPSETPKRRIVVGRHSQEAHVRLCREIGNDEGVLLTCRKAEEIIANAVEPSSETHGNDSVARKNEGLLYGLIQSGKTSVITVVAAMAADNDFQCIVILTSDIDVLYEQTLERVKRALPGLPVLGKRDWRDAAGFERKLGNPPLVIVCSKNGSKLKGLLDAFRTARSAGLSAMIIDDEADQASLNTFTSKDDGRVSKINEVISQLRDFFRVNTYLQVTATPQALFLQRPGHPYRPNFSVLSEPSAGYVGGDKFFGDGSLILRDVDIREVNGLLASRQPHPTGAAVPRGLRQALYSFLVAGAAKEIKRPGENCAFLCHVSMSNADHRHIKDLLDRFNESLVRASRNPSSLQYEDLVKSLRSEYEDLQKTEKEMPKFESVLEKILLYLPGTNVKLINAASDEEIKLDSVYNVFVGGNKLGRGVTIRNLLTSYYGRNPRRPNADTVLQHARMYGYRQNDIGLTRLFLPAALAEHFIVIHGMETALRDLVKRHPRGEFEGIYISSSLRPTRANVLDPNSIGIYLPGSYCNPKYPLRSQEMVERTQKLDSMLEAYADDRNYDEVNVDFLLKIIHECEHDPKLGAEMWDKKILTAALETLAKVRTLQGEKAYGGKAYVCVKRGRNLDEPRRENQGFLTGGEEALVPKNAPALFIYRLNESRKGVAVWWPLLRFPSGAYALAFSFDWRRIRRN